MRPPRMSRALSWSPSTGVTTVVTMCIALTTVAFLAAWRASIAAPVREPECYALRYADPLGDASADLFPAHVTLFPGVDSGDVASHASEADTAGFWRMFQHDARWTRVSGDSIALRFSNLFTGIVLQARRDLAGLSGRATVHWDAIVPGHVTAMRLTGVRERCPAPSVVCPKQGWRASSSYDGTIALCLAPGYGLVPRYDLVSGALWTHGTVADSDYAWLGVHVLDSAAAAEEWGQPPAPRSFRVPAPAGLMHRVVADSVVVHDEEVDGVPVSVETALVSGGFAGWRRQPVLRAAWPLPGQRWALVQGYASTPGELAVQRAMLRTMRLGVGGE